MKRSVLTLFSAENDVLSHIIRLALTEKGIAYQVDLVGAKSNLTKPGRINDYARESADRRHKYEFPYICDRDLVVEDIRIILEYLDDKYPHPTLLPTDPETKAKFRIIIEAFHRDLLPYARKLSGTDDEEINKSCDYIINYVNEDLLPLWDNQFYYICHEEFSILDCYLAPIIHRVIRIREANKEKLETKIIQYHNRMRTRPSFMNSLQSRASKGFMDS